MTSLRFVLAASLALLAAPLAAVDLEFNQVQLIPTARLGLGDAALIAPQHFADLGIEPGRQAFLESESGERVVVFLFAIDREPDSVSMRAELREALGVEPGEARLFLTLATAEETGVEDMDLSVEITRLAGDPRKWPRIVLGAPHASSDRHTGEIAEIASDLGGIPMIGGWRGRISHIGRWIDTNRPYQREEVELFSIAPDRSWTQEAEDVYHLYRDALIAVGRADDFGPISPPLDLYVDFHGHGLRVQMPDGSNPLRPNYENMARGFTRPEVRELQEMFRRALDDEFGDEAPAAYWANFAEDINYVIDGVEVRFRYPGLGARVNGALSPEIARRSIHIETPSIMRTDPDIRPRTARVLHQFMVEVKERFILAEPQWAYAPGGEFPMRGNRTVHLDPFHISKLPVTNREYADFVNRALADGTAEVVDHIIVDVADGSEWAMLAPIGPHSGLVAHPEGVVALPSLADHPVVHVSYHGALAFAAHHDARLPTEAEWEYAARWDPEASALVEWNQSDDPLHENLPDGNYMHSPQREGGMILGTTTPVGAFPGHATPIGCLDMTGNTWEWTSDWDGNLVSSRGAVLDNPTGPDDGSMKIIKGGSWDSEPVTVEPTNRLAIAPHSMLATVGFRIVGE